MKELLHYSVDLTCKTSLVFPACKVTVPAGSPVEGIMGRAEQQSQKSCGPCEVHIRMMTHGCSLVPRLILETR